MNIVPLRCDYATFIQERIDRANASILTQPALSLNYRWGLAELNCVLLEHQSGCAICRAEAKALAAEEAALHLGPDGRLSDRPLAVAQ